jgi:hypothetical protein
VNSESLLPRAALAALIMIAFGAMALAVGSWELVVFGLAACVAWLVRW